MSHVLPLRSGISAAGLVFGVGIAGALVAVVVLDG
jgi:hypothetical protein